MTKVRFTFVDVQGDPLPLMEFRIHLRRASFNEEDVGVVLPEELPVITDELGQAIVELWPLKTAYRVVVAEEFEEVCGKLNWTFYVPETEEIVEAQDLFLVPPPRNIAWDEEAIGKITQAVQDTKDNSEAAEGSANRAEDAAQSVAGDAQDAREAAAAAQEAAQGIGDGVERALDAAVRAKASEDAAGESAQTANQVAANLDGIEERVQGYAQEAVQAAEQTALDVVSTDQNAQLALSSKNSAGESATLASDKAVEAAESVAQIGTAVSDATAQAVRARDEADRAEAATDGKVDKETGKGLSTNDFNNEAKDKLTSLPTIDQLTAAFAGKVDKVAGKGLSTHDLTNELYEKLQTIEGSRWQGVYTSLEALAAAVPAGQPGFYAWVDPGEGEPVQMAIWDIDDAIWRIGEGAAGQMTPAQVLEALLENPDVNVLTNAQLNLLLSVEAGAEVNPLPVNQTQAEAGVSELIFGWSPLRIRQLVSAWWNNTSAKAKLDSISEGAQVNPTAATQSQAEAGTEATILGFSALRIRQAIVAWWNGSADKTKLDGVAEGAQANAPAVTLAEAQAGTVEDLRSWSVLRVWQAIQAWWNASAMKTKLDSFPSMPPADGKTYALKDGQWVEAASGGAGGGNLFDVQFYTGLRANLGTERPGFAFLDGQKALRSMWPDAFARITNYPIATEAAWAAGDKGKFTLGDGSTDFRLADWNGATGGKARVLRGGVAGTEGTFEEDAFQAHDRDTGLYAMPTNPPTDNSLEPGTAAPTNGVVVGQSSNSYARYNQRTGAFLTRGNNGTPRVADETRAASVKGAWIVRLSNAVGPVGEVDVQALASEVAALPSKVPVLIKETRYTQAGAINHVFNSMASVYEVEIWGAGGGAGTNTALGVAGGDTTFGTLIAHGGGGGGNSSGAYPGKGGTATGGLVNLTGQQGGVVDPDGYVSAGGASPLGGSGGFGGAAGVSTEEANGSAPGGGGLVTINARAGGGGGGYCRDRKAVVGGSTISGVVGSGGTSAIGGNGAPGEIRIREYSSNLPGIDVVNQLINEMAAARPTRVAYSGAASLVALGTIPADATKVTININSLVYAGSTNIVLEMDDGSGNWLPNGVDGTTTVFSASGVSSAKWSTASNMIYSGSAAGTYVGKITLEKTVSGEWLMVEDLGNITAVYGVRSVGKLPGSQSTQRSLRITSSSSITLTATVKVEK